MKIRILSFTKQGGKLNQDIVSQLLQLGHDCVGYGIEKYALKYGLLPMKEGLTVWSQRAFEECEGIIYIGACGIAVRGIAPYVKDKFLDPCVLSVDEKGKYVIPLLSGHVGRGNELANCISTLTGGIPIITTATDLNGVFAIDVFAKKNDLIIGDREKAKKISAYHLENTKNTDEVRSQNKSLNDRDRMNPLKVSKQNEENNIYKKDMLNKKSILKTDFYIEGDTPKEVQIVCNSNTNVEENQLTLDETDIRISIYKPKVTEKKALSLIPSVTCLGIGCRKGVNPEDLEVFVLEQLEKEYIQIQSIKRIGSIDLKQGEEALLSLAEKYQWEFITYSSEELQKVLGHFLESDFVKSISGVGNVCERAAMLASNNGTLIMNKTTKNGMTLAIAVMDRRLYFE